MIHGATIRLRKRGANDHGDRDDPGQPHPGGNGDGARP